MANLFQGVSHAAAYSKYRISPPDQLIYSVISYLKANIDPPFKQAVDVGCGSGHSTVALAPYFENIVGLDVSEAQIANAKKERAAPNVNYRVSPAEETDFADSSVDLVATGQALHWFDHDKFFNEVKRILVPNGVFAAYGYWIPTPTVENAEKAQELHYLIRDHLHDQMLGKYWDSRRYNILREYFTSIELPFSNCTKQNFVKSSVSSVSDYMGYLTSWSAYAALYTEDREKAIKLLQDVRERIMTILETSDPPEKAILSIATDFFLIMGTRSNDDDI